MLKIRVGLEFNKMRGKAGLEFSSLSDVRPDRGSDD